MAIQIDFIRQLSLHIRIWVMNEEDKDPHFFLVAIWPLNGAAVNKDQERKVFNWYWCI